MTSTAVAPTNAAQAGYSTSGTNNTTSTSSTASSTSSLNNGLASLADNFQGFLSLLTTQLKNQDPTSPMDTNAFTQQITQMTGVEQQLLSNQLLQQLVTQQGSVGSAASLIGDTVTAPGLKTGDPDITGTVTAVTTSNGETMLTVGSNQVPMSSLTSVTSSASNLAGLLGG
ncbi:MAG TPA: flagellar hook capping FlgD N-terminal domain-containing protein [Caulobacteraceae bacterium]|jgi:flagellar basal-body rod modification protein FlgD|nr:flagellar hook capping FlgD N-terminal domain-containing protein [Caulobacteraceae bacterium]